MSFSYNGTIPNPPDDPADDVDQMQTNSASISSLIAVDHVGFNSFGPVGAPPGSGGQHLQVTFNGNNVPAVSPSLSYLFTNTQSPAPAINLNQLFFFPAGANAAQSSGQYNSTSSSGSTYLLGGIILKWGSGSNAQNATGNNIGFASAFPNSCFVVIAVSTDGGNDNAANTYVYPRSFSASGFNLLSTKRTSLSGVTSNYAYIAIGN